jgi:peptide/nickel transport system permease protein
MLRSFGLIIFISFFVVAVLAPVISPYDPRSYDGPTLSAPSDEFLLGTNDLGQDILSQLIHGTRTSLFVGITVALISTLISVVLGLLSGYNRRLDPYIMGLCNMILAIPNLLIVIIVVAFSGAHLWNVILVLSLMTWPGYARIIRSQVLSLRERDYVRAAQTFGAKQSYILYKHIFPSIYPLAIVKFVNTAQSAVVTEASLSFLGLGDITEISWGTMLHYAFQYSSTFVTSAWQWWVLPPTLCIVLFILSFAFIGYGLEGRKSLSIRADRKMRLPKSFQSVSGLTVNDPLENDQDVFPNPNALMEIRDMRVEYPNQEKRQEVGTRHITAVDEVSLTIQKGEILALIGESGSGKTTIGKALLGMLPSARVTGSIYFRGKDLMEMTSRERVRLRWVDISMIFQDAKQSLNPVLKIGEQVDEVLIYHKRMKKQVARALTKALLQDVGLGESLVNSYPHELSGGMCTRVVIAMALACEPDLLIADEPTSSLDTITRKKIMALLQDKVRQYNLAMLFITHDMGVVAELADKAVVIKGGRIVERASVWDLFTSPKQPYTKELVGSRQG